MKDSNWCLQATAINVFAEINFLNKVEKVELVSFW